MITLVLVDLDNVIGDDFRLPGSADLVDLARAALPRGKRDPRRREAVAVVIAANEHTTYNQNVKWSALRELAAQFAVAVEEHFGRPAPARVEVEPILMPSRPEAVDGALLRSLAHAPSARSAGQVLDVLLVSDDRGLARRVNAALPSWARRETKRGGLSWWRWGPSWRPLLRKAPNAANVPAAEPTSQPTRVVHNAAHAAWAEGVPVQLEACDLKRAASRIACMPWLRTQLSVTEQSVTGPARLRALLDGQPATLAVGAGETVDVQAAPVQLGTMERVEAVGPGTVRVRWGERGAQVLRTELPAALVRDAGPLRLRGRPGTIDDGALLDARDGELLYDPSWTVSFLKHRDGFRCEVEHADPWPPIWWHWKSGAMEAKMTGQGVSTPRPIRNVPVRLAVVRGKLRVRSVTDAGEVRLVRRGQVGQLVAAESAQGKCVALCASDTGAKVSVPCRPIHQVDVSVLASHLRANADWLVRQGVPELPIVVVGVRDPRRSRLVHERR